MSGPAAPVLARPDFPLHDLHSHRRMPMHTLVFFRRFVSASLLLAAGLTFADPQSASPSSVDLLQIPALQSVKAPGELLLDVSSVGARLVAVGNRGIILRSDDHGQSWQQSEVPVSLTLTSVHFPSPQRGWAAGHDGIVLGSTDGGLTWQSQLDGNTINALILDDLNEQIARHEALDAGADPAHDERLERLQLRLEDAEAGAEFGPSRPILDIWFADDARGYAVGAFGQLLQTRDGGGSWRSLGGRLDNPDSLHLNSITALGAGRLYIAGEQGNLWTSADAGESWRRMDTGYQGSLYGVLSPDGHALLAYGFGGHLFRSYDDGATWSAVTRFTDKALVAHARTADGRIILFGRDGSAFASADEGHVFQPLERTARGSIAAVTLLDDGRLLMVGSAGIQIIASPSNGH